MTDVANLREVLAKEVPTSMNARPQASGGSRVVSSILFTATLAFAVFELVRFVRNERRNVLDDDVDDPLFQPF